MQILSKIKPLQLVIFFLITVGIFLNFSRLIKSDFDIFNLVDFKTIYASTNVWKENKNPFTKQNVIDQWKEICKNENIEFEIDYIMTVGPQYPPNTFVYIYPLTFLSYKFTSIIILMLLAFSIIGIVILTNKIFPQIPILLIATSLVAFKGMAVYLNGQPLFLSLFAGLLAIYFSEKNKPILVAFFLILCSIKITIVLPFLAYIFIKNNYKLDFKIWIIGSLWLMFNVYLFGDLTFLHEFTKSVNIWQTYIYDLTLEEKMISLTLDFKAILTVFNIYHPILKWSILVVIAYLILKNKSIREDKLLLFMAIYTFFCIVTYHGYYDIFPVVPLVVYLVWKNHSFDIELILFCICAMIPINGIVKLLHYQVPLILEINMTICTFLLLIWLIRKFNKPFNQIKSL